MKYTEFDLDRFQSLSGKDLEQYFTLANRSPGLQISDSVFARLVSAMESMDCQHLVYAIEICRHLKPAQFAAQAAGYLANPDVAVAGAAQRALEAVPKELVTEELVDLVAQTPITALYRPDDLGYGLRYMGTNREFVQMLLDKWAAASD